MYINVTWTCFTSNLMVGVCVVYVHVMIFIIDRLVWLPTIARSWEKSYQMEKETKRHLDTARLSFCLHLLQKLTCTYILRKLTGLISALWFHIHLLLGVYHIQHLLIYLLAVVYIYVEGLEADLLTFVMSNLRCARLGDKKIIPIGLWFDPAFLIQDVFGWFYS